MNKDYANKFHKALLSLKSRGIMGNLVESPDKKPLDSMEVEQTILRLLPSRRFDIIISYNSTGEYTKQQPYEEIGKSVINLWHSGQILTSKLWTFAYENGNRLYCPKPVKSATIYLNLSKQIWLHKYDIVTDIYRFASNSWEAQTTPRSETFWKFSTPQEAKQWAECEVVYDNN